MISLTNLLGCLLIGLGTLLMVVVVTGIFRVDFVLNRLHVTAIADTLGTLLIFIGAVLIKGIDWVDLKLLLILVLQWFTVPVCGHMIAQLEYAVVGHVEEHLADDTEFHHHREEEM
ncbi:MAG: monovalent cation/H(+) antiporter subunit G [Oscillospiraceae bacterium]|nr:monovalent cation/H(+) antiporter subunit G [Oscillospiraceae bacterium]